MADKVTHIMMFWSKPMYTVSNLSLGNSASYDWDVSPGWTTVESSSKYFLVNSQRGPEEGEGIN